MPGIANDVGIVVAGFGIAWMCCFLGAVVRVVHRWLSGSGDCGDPGV